MANENSVRRRITDCIRSVRSAGIAFARSASRGLWVVEGSTEQGGARRERINGWVLRRTGEKSDEHSIE